MWDYGYGIDLEDVDWLGTDSWAQSIFPIMKRWPGRSTGGNTATAACSPTHRITLSLLRSASPLCWPSWRSDRLTARGLDHSSPALPEGSVFFSVMRSRMESLTVSLHVELHARQDSNGGSMEQWSEHHQTVLSGWEQGLKITGGWV